MRPLWTIARTGILALVTLVTVTERGTGQRRSQDRFSPVWAPVKAFFHHELPAEGVVGGSLAFFHGDTLLAHEFHGDADLATKRPVDGQTIYHWASITKTFTGIAI